MKSPIKYFGGKGMMYPDILKHFPPHDSYVTYVEPFGGAASVLFQKEPSRVEVYNDIWNNVYSLFKVLQDPELFDRFKHKLDLTYYSRQLLCEFRQDLKLENINILERAYRYFYVNRAAYGGVGGFASTVTVRRNMSKSVSDFLSTIDKLPYIHQRLSRVIIENQDALKLIPRYGNKDTFMYMDPPYHHDTRTSARYACDMSDEQYDEFIDLLINLECRVLLSGYAAGVHDRLERYGWQRIDFDVKTVDGKNKPKTEIESLWKNY